MEVGIRVHNGNETEQLDPEKIRELASFYQLDTLIPNRYTSLFVVNLYLLEKVSGVNPEQVIEEIKSLEGLAHPITHKSPASKLQAAWMSTQGDGSGTGR